MAESASKPRPLLRPLVSAGQQTVAGVLIGSLAILIVSAAAGLIANGFSPRRIPLFPAVRARDVISLPLPPGIRSMVPQEAYDAFQTRSALFVDARSPDEYAQGHIPGAINIPVSDFENGVVSHMDQLDSAPAVATYCPSMECWDAVDVADRLREVTQKPIYVFEQGWEAWQADKHPITKGDQP
jgi:rhodanese-related sulfurtransferase